MQMLGQVGDFGELQVVPLGVILVRIAKVQARSHERARQEGKFTQGNNPRLPDRLAAYVDMVL